MKHKFHLMYRKSEAERGLVGDTEVEADAVRFDGELVTFWSYTGMHSNDWLVLAVPASEILMLRQVN